MGRHMQRRRLVPPVERWEARRDARGQWVVVNTLGEQPLVHVDPLVRLEAVWLASKAPEMRHALKQLAERTDRFFRDHGMQRFRDNQFVFVAMGVLRDTLPPWTEVVRLRQHVGRGKGTQLEVDLTAHEADSEAA